MNKIAILVVFVFMTKAYTSPAKEREQNMDPVYNLALDGNVQAAMEKLYSIDPGILTPAEQQTRQNYIDRFASDAAPVPKEKHTLLDEVIAVFHEYWHRVLLQKLSQTAGQHFLFNQLRSIAERLGARYGEFSDDEAEKVAAFLIAKLRDSGYFAQIGNVSPHTNFMAWRSERTKNYRVDLGDGESQIVDVVLMENFESLGWAGYATFDKFHVGGWVGEESLHCVASSYDLESEKYKVSFLAHEARHFADIKNYPKLKSLDLEYRAKLNELLLARQILSDLLKKFIFEQRKNPNNPHSYASFLLLQNLSAKLMKPVTLGSLPSLDLEQVRNYAKELLNEHTLQLRKHDPMQVETIMPPT